MFKTIAVISILMGTSAVLRGQPQVAPAQAASAAVPQQAEKVMQIGGSVKPPTVISTSNVKADPSSSHQKPGKWPKFQGNVLVSLIVNKDGNPTDIRVVRSCSHKDLDEKAVEAVSQYRFHPATDHGKPVAVDLVVEVNFQIF